MSADLEEASYTLVNNEGVQDLLPSNDSLVHIMRVKCKKRARQERSSASKREWLFMHPHE